MPFAVKDALQHKRNERQIRDIHEREYSKYISNLRQQSFHSNLSHLSDEHMKEIERSRVRNLCNRNTQYDRIQRENDLLAKRLFHTKKPTMISDKNDKYQQNLDVFKTKHIQQRANEYQRIDNENQLLLKRINSVRGRLADKQQCDRDWQRHIHVMKKTCDYPENIDRFVSNNQFNQHHRICKWNQRYNHLQRLSQVTDRPLSVLLGLVE